MPHAADPIFEHAASRPDDPALIFAGGAIGFGELARRVDAAAETLGASGAAAAGEGAVARIGLACPDGLEYVLLSLALLRAGACVAPIAPELTAAERERVVGDLALDALVIEGRFTWPDPPGRRLTLTPVGPDKPVHVHTALGGGDARRAGFDEAALAALGPAFIRFSSGTTGRSKGVVLSHRALLDRTAAANRALRIGPGDRVLWILPMAHHFAVSMMLYLTQGAATVIPEGHLASDVLDAAAAHGATVLYGSPYHHAMLGADESSRAWPTLRLAVSTAAALPRSTAEAFDRRFGVPLTQALGVIEAGLPIINTHRARDKPTAIGRPTPGFEVELRDEHGRALCGPSGAALPDQVGEVHVRGPGLFDAYLRPWRPRAEALTGDGFFSTGDLARRDAEGDLFLVGRTKSVINVAGLKVFPEEVEAALCEHRGVAAARVFGRGHPRWGAVVEAQVVPRDPDQRPGASALAAWCRDKLAAYKRPTRFWWVASLARTASGKIKRDTGPGREAPPGDS